MRESEIAELRTFNRHLEQRAITAHRTLAYGLGKALIEARSLRGMLALPGKIRRLRLKQTAKRRSRVPDSATGDATRDMRFVDEALERLACGGAAAAAAWAEALPDKDRSAKARAMAELAIAMAEERAELAASLGERAAALDAAQPRLLALALGLRERGLVAAPAAIGEAIRGAQLFNEAQSDMLARIAEDAYILLQSHPDSQLRDVRISSGRSDGVLIIHAVGDRLDHRVARIGAIAEQVGLAWRAVEMARFALDPIEPPPRLVHILASGLAATRKALTTARLAGSPVLLDIGAIAAEAGGERGKVNRLRLAWLVKAASAVVARSEVLAEAIAVAGGETPRVALDHFETPPGDPTLAALEFAIPEEARLIGCVAPLDHEPGPERLLAGFAALSGEDPLLRLVLIGRGPAMAALGERAARLGVGDRVDFLGLPLAARWPDLFARCDLVVAPREAPLEPGSGLETALGVALACGSKTIASAEAWRWTSAPASGAILPDNQDGWARAITDAASAHTPKSSHAPTDLVIAELHRAVGALGS